MDIRLDELASIRGYPEKRHEIAIAAKSRLMKRHKCGPLSSRPGVPSTRKQIAAMEPQKNVGDMIVSCETRYKKRGR